MEDVVILEQSDLDFVKSVINGNIPPEEVNGEGNTAMIVAIKGGRPELVDGILQVYNRMQNWFAENGEYFDSFVKCAIKEIQPSVLAYFVKNPSKFRYNHARTFQGIYYNCDLEVLKKMFEYYDLDVNETFPNLRKNMFEEATRLRIFNVDKYKYLIERGGQVLRIRDDGLTIFHIAILQHCDKAVEVCLEFITPDEFHNMNLELSERFGPIQTRNSYGHVFHFAVRHATPPVIKMFLPYIHEIALNSWIGSDRKHYNKFLAMAME
ncbi:hypothetical protein CHUAL_006297 [Chamberlinius hualienensis]